MKKTLLVIAGPTASGKTDLSISLAKNFETEIISADSRQLFIELNIGAAKPSPEQLKMVPHHFISKYSVSVNYNAGRFAIEGRQLLDDLFTRLNLVILTGGSGLYIDALLNGMDDLPGSDETIRAQLSNEFREMGIDFLQNKLKVLDPIGFSKIDIANPYRLIRALEVSIITGNPYSSYLLKKKETLPFSVIYLGLDVRRDILYNRINKRVDAMIKEGLVEEVKSLVPYKSNAALKTVGYAELFDYLDQVISLQEAIDKIKQHTRNYAKRQMTWFRKEKSIHWVNPENEMDIIDFIKRQTL